MPDDISDTSSSVATLERDEEEQRRREKRRKKKKSSKHRDNDSDSDERRHCRRSDKKRKKHKKSISDKREQRKRDRKRHRKRYGEEDSSHGSKSDDDSRRFRHHKKSRKEQKRKRKRNHDNSDATPKSKDDRVGGASSRSEQTSTINTRGQILAKALHHLFLDKPEFASELPLMLIRLAGGTTFDLRQVNDPSIAMGLQTVFEALETFGVQKQDDTGMWMFQTPPGATRKDELVLLRLVRSLLNDVDLTMDRVEAFDAKPKTQEPTKIKQAPAESILEKEENKKMKEATFAVLKKFLSKDATLGSQLAGLCMTIVEGDSVSVDGIPDDDLKASLESLFQTCGLKKSEIEDEDDSNEDDDESPLMGYGLPVDGSDDVQMKLATIMAACREGPPKPKSIGPMRRPMTEEEQRSANEMYGSNNNLMQEKDEEEDEDGPLLPGEARKVRGPTMSLEVIKAQAEYRELELKSTSTGVPMPSQNGGREEWMINPGEHTFLSGIKSGQTIKGRGFQNKKSRDNKEAPPVHPAVQAEMDAIMYAHENARGPSLMDLHHSKKSRGKELAAKNSDRKNEWKWSRDNDLDAGRRVDKNALGMILGGGASDLKSKFAGGFNR